MASYCKDCNVKLGWIWGRGHKCTVCKAKVCKKCIKYNTEYQLVCSDCHHCGYCYAKTNYKDLQYGGSYWLCTSCYKIYDENSLNWKQGTRYEFLKGYSIIKEFELIRIDKKCNDPAQVEFYIKTQAIMLGANAYIKFFFDKNIEYHQEEYIAGYGSKGNPYYKTKRYTTAYYTGYAVAVLVKNNSQSR